MSRTLFGVMLLAMVVDPSVAQDDSQVIGKPLGATRLPKPFVEYPKGPDVLLKRLHGKESPQFPPGRLAFRSDYPGGFNAWQCDARQIDRTAWDRSDYT
jgi:hypothetical protein